jgi:hypothetical protein
MAVVIEAMHNSGNTGALIAVVLEKTMEETGKEREDLWGPIAMTNWRDTPCIQGRTATEDDANAGRAVFYPNLSKGQESRPVDLDLPRCAILHEVGENDLPVIVIQAEEGNNGADAVEPIAGYRPLTGGSGICMLYQLEFLSEPDHRFAEFYPRLTGLSLTLENRPPLLEPTLPDVRTAVDSLTPDGGPGFLVLEAEAGDYVQAAGGGNAFTAEWREYAGEQFQHWVAGTRGLPHGKQIRIRTNGATVTVNENERLQSTDVKSIVEAFANHEQRPPAYMWRDITQRFK